MLPSSFSKNRKNEVLKSALLIAWGLCLGIHALGQESWPRFRGPNGSGIADTKPPVKLEASNLAWKTPLPKGLSSPIAVRGKVFVTGIDEKRLVTECYDGATGKRLWRREAPEASIEKVHEFNSPATPTPCADDESVYVYFGSSGLICYDFNGGVRWQKSLPTPNNLYGTASSPILHEDLLILVLDDDGNLEGSRLSKSRMVAFKKATGEVAWETARPLHRSGWSTPAIWYKEGGNELVVLGSGRLCGYDPLTGTEKWFVRGFARETAVVPVFENGYVFASSAMGGIADEAPDYEPLWKAMLHFDANKDSRISTNEITEHFTFPLRPEVPVSHPGFGVPVPSDPVRRAERQRSIFNAVDKDRDGVWTHEEFLHNLGPRPFKPWLVAVRPGGTGDVTDTHVAWELRRSIPELPSAIVHHDILYMVRNGGILTAVDAASGKLIYDERINAPGQYSASPVIANGHVYLASNKGMISVVKVGSKFELADQHDLGESIFVTPAISGNTLYIRSDSHLHAFTTK